jgi:hypothetical protein
MAAGVEALVAMWGAFERGWHAEWLALRAAAPPADLNPKLCAPGSLIPTGHLSATAAVSMFEACRQLHAAGRCRLWLGWRPDSLGDACA